MVAESRSYLSSDARAARAANSLERRSAVRRNENTTRAMQTFRLFVSSPGDVMVERRRVENVVSRLNGEFAGVARLEAIRWETEFYQAYSTFQAQIPRSTDCDLVIGILRWRLGTELPPDFGEKLPDDQPFPSGTAYEILTAIDKRQNGGSFPTSTSSASPAPRPPWRSTTRTGRGSSTTGRCSRASSRNGS